MPGLSLAANSGPDSIAPVYAETAVAPQMAPLSTEFATYILRQLGPFAGMSEGDYVPSPSDASTAQPDLEPGVLSLPDSFDLRTTGKLTAVRNQGGYGTCWAFATVGSLESALLPTSTQDFSEDHMALASGYFSAGATADDHYNTGGNYEMSTAYMARWGGPVFESDQPYGTGYVVPGLFARAHVQDVSWLPARTSPADNDAIKAALVEHGAVGTTMYWTSAAYRSATRSYYYTGTTGSNHAVDIVGWDDSYSATNFATTPAGNGAWLVRNSWGTSWGDGGYFHVSYYDGRFGKSSNVIVEPPAPPANYSGVLQYDPLGRTSYYGYGSPTAWFMNKFAIESTSTVRALSFYARQPGSSYELYVGTSGTLTKLATGSLVHGGYHTVALPAPVLAPNGVTLSVAVKLTTPGYNYPVGTERTITGYSDQATAQPGQGFISSDGTYWTDMYSVCGGSVCLKAFVDVASGDATAPVTSLSSSPASSTAGWYRTPVTISLTASDTGSGPWATYYRLNSALPRTYTAPVVLSSQGTNTIEYWSVDAAGNVETSTVAAFRLDTIAPSTSVHRDPAANGNGWNTGSVVTSLSAADSGSGVGTTFFRLGSSEASPYETPITVADQGVTRLECWTTDLAGNVETVRTSDVKIDWGAPQVSLDATSAYINVATIRASANDTVSGVDLVWMSVDTTGSWSYGTQISAKGEGTHTVYARVFDAAGNSAATSATFTITTVPVTYATRARLTGASRVKARHTLRLSGTVSAEPSVGRVRIVRTRLVGGKWRRAGSVSVSVTGGRYAYSFRPAQRGRWRFSASYSGGVEDYITYRPCRSGSVYTRVR